MHYVSPKDSEEHLLATAFDAEGNLMDDDFVSKLMAIPAISSHVSDIDLQSVAQCEKEKLEALSGQIKQRNKQFINDESVKIERWAEDQTFSVKTGIEGPKKAD